MKNGKGQRFMRMGKQVEKGGATQREGVQVEEGVLLVTIRL